MTPAPFSAKVFRPLRYGSHPGVDNGSVPAQTPNNPAALMQTDFDILFGPGVVTVIDRAEPVHAG